MKLFGILSYIIFFLLFSLSVDAQKKRIMLFDDYNNGVVFMKNKQRVNSKLNYDTANKKIMYLQNGEEMILLNNAQIDSVKILDRIFIQLVGLYLEKIAVENGEIFIDWSNKNIYKGKKGAYGQVSQAKVETINTSHWTNNEYKNESVDVYETRNNNTYWFFENNIPVKCGGVKDLIKIFPQKSNDILDYVKINKIDFYKTSDAIKLIDFCLSKK